MIKGGYKIVDLKDTDFTVGTEAAIVGIHDAIESNYRKPILLSGITIASAKYNDTFVNFVLSGTSYVGVLNTVWTNATSAVATVITVADTDDVTISTATVSVV